MYYMSIGLGYGVLGVVVICLWLYKFLLVDEEYVGFLF